MRILIINPPHQAIGSRMPGEMLPPLGLLAVGGPLIDDGHDVTLLDADVDNLRVDAIIRRAMRLEPEAVLIGHNGSTSAHPTIAEIIARLRPALPDAWFVYGGVFPTYHWKECLEQCPQIDVIVRGEGEETTRKLMRALTSPPPLWGRPGGGETVTAVLGIFPDALSGLPPTPIPSPQGGGELSAIPGIAFRRSGRPHATPPAPMIANLDDYRVGWELIDHAKYSYYGGKRGVVVQFSRGCPHLCSYCGQRGFWTRWRHRDPKKFAAELGRLHREHGVTMISFADENPTTSKKVWRELLKAIIAEGCNFTMIATLRADDIVRDADILHLYRQAGFERFLIGMENTDDATLAKVKKGSVTKTDREAIKLLRRHGILSLMTCVFGFNEERDRDYCPHLPAVARLRSRPDHHAVRDAASLDAFLCARERPARHSARPVALGLQASGARQSPHSGVACVPVGQADRGADPGAAQGACAHLSASRSGGASRHALVCAHRQARVALRDLGVRDAHTARQAWPDARAVLGRTAGLGTRGSQPQHAPGEPPPGSQCSMRHPSPAEGGLDAW